MFSKLRNKNNMIGEIKDAVCLTFKVVVHSDLSPILDSLYSKCSIEVNKMLENREESSSKYYPSIPCVVAKSLITKYQRNKKCKAISNLTIPICGDKGKQVKVVGGGIRIPALFKKVIIPITFPKPIVGNIRQVEFFKCSNVWLMSYSYNTPTVSTKIHLHTFLGVDRNSVGNVATIALPNGKTMCLGPSSAGITNTFRKRKAKLQKKNKKEALKKLKRKQSRRVKDINHKVSRAIVNLAEEHCSAIVLEDLGKISKVGKSKRYVQKSQWSFYQLETFIRYKAALLGIPVTYVSARYTSQTCSKCGSINKPSGKRYKCSVCGHVAHRDGNAALNIRDRAVEQGRGVKPLSGHIDVPQNKTTCALVELESSGGAR